MIELLQDDRTLFNEFTLDSEYGRIEISREKPDEESMRNALEPRVSRYLVEHGEDFTYPEDKRFAVCLTHDVDDIYPPFTHAAMSMASHAGRLDIRGLNEDILWPRHGKKASPYRNFSRIMELEEKYGATSSFYFMATDRDVKRFRYNIEDLEGDLGAIVDKGWEVGLHGGYYAYDRLEEIKKEKARLEKVLGRNTIGYRNHYLRFSVPKTWEYLEKAGFRYDTTIGYNQTVGFRNGMCHPYRPYDRTDGKYRDILEIPMAIMDCSVFEQGRTQEGAWELAKQLVDAAEQYHGVVTLLWHNDAFGVPFRDGWVKLYNKLLKYSSDKNAWITSGENICRWWEKNGR